MTETRATPLFPPGRYGRRREPRRVARWAPAAVTVLGVLAGLLVTVHLYDRFGNPPYRAAVLAYGDITDDGVTVRFDVHKPADRAAVCRVRARARHGGEVGHADVPVPAGAAKVAMTYRLRTTEKPLTGEVTGCRAAP